MADDIIWITKGGKHIPIKNGYTVSEGQKEYEEKIRSKRTETGAFFDKDGNVLMESDGDAEKVEFQHSPEFNHNVEQRIWNDEEVHFTHNHPDNTIFSPEDMDVMEDLEYSSMRAVLPNGTSYTIIRDQPRSTGEIVIDMKTGESYEKNPPKRIAKSYAEEYDKVWDKAYDDIIANYRADARKLKLAELDQQTAEHMRKWLEKNAEKYGYRFVYER